MVIGHEHAKSVTILRGTDPGWFELGGESSPYPMEVMLSDAPARPPPSCLVVRLARRMRQSTRDVLGSPAGSTECASGGTSPSGSRSQVRQMVEASQHRREQHCDLVPQLRGSGLLLVGLHRVDLHARRSRRFHVRGCGEPNGEFPAGGSAETWVDDLAIRLDTMRS